MLTDIPDVPELESLSNTYDTDFEQNNISLPSFATAFTNSYGAITSDDSGLPAFANYICLDGFPTTEDVHLNHSVNEEFYTEQLSESGNDSKAQGTVQKQSSTIRSSKPRKYLNKHICQYCGQVLKTQRSLICHERIHENKKPFVCDACGRAFRNQDQLKEHKYTHTDERKYECSECGKRFRQRSVLYFHKAIHTKTLLQECPVCLKKFPFRAYLKSHSYTHQSLSYRCSCGKGFKTKVHLERHLRGKTMTSRHAAELGNPE